jgi:LTXXQ motif family protein
MRRVARRDAVRGSSPSGWRRNIARSALAGSARCRIPRSRAGIQPPRHCAIADYGQLDHFDALASKFDHRLHQSPPNAGLSRIGYHIHAQSRPLCASFLPLWRTNPAIPNNSVERNAPNTRERSSLWQYHASGWAFSSSNVLSNASTDAASYRDIRLAGLKNSPEAVTGYAPGEARRREKAMSAQLEALRKLKTAVEPLYAALSDDQKKTADQLMIGPMGITSMGMM